MCDASAAKCSPGRPDDEARGGQGVLLAGKKRAQEDKLRSESTPDCRSHRLISVVPLLYQVCHACVKHVTSKGNSGVFRKSVLAVHF